MASILTLFTVVILSACMRVVLWRELVVSAEVVLSFMFNLALQPSFYFAFIDHAVAQLHHQSDTSIRLHLATAATGPNSEISLQWPKVAFSGWNHCFLNFSCLCLLSDSLPRRHQSQKFQ